jgi:hypothetical protein
VIIENQTSAHPVQITGLIIRNRNIPWQSSYFGERTWGPSGEIHAGYTAVQYVMSTTSMPIVPGAEFEALVTMSANGVSDTISLPFNPSELYSQNSPEQNPRVITITDSDVPDSIKRPGTSSKTEDQVKDEISKAKEGEIINIDGIEWIKVKHYSYDSDKVLLMLKGVTGSPVQYNTDGNCIEYNGSPKPSIKAIVDNWYDYLNSPILKSIALLSNVSETPNQTWPSSTLAGTKAGTVAFIPKLDDINTTKLSKANGFRYWLSDINFVRGCRSNCIIKANGDFANGLQSVAPDVYIRPCVWVMAR